MPSMQNISTQSDGIKIIPRISLKISGIGAYPLKCQEYILLAMTGIETTLLWLPGMMATHLKCHSRENSLTKDRNCSFSFTMAGNRALTMPGIEETYIQGNPAQIFSLYTQIWFPI